VLLDAAPATATKPAVATVAPTAPKPAAAVPAATKPTATLAKPASGFAVQLSAPASETDANALRDRARGAGFAAFVQRVDSTTGVRYRVRLGPSADRAAAEAMQADAKAKLGIAGIVVATP
jgi:DedD protein